MTKTEIADRLGWSKQKLNYYLRHKNKISIEDALKIDVASYGQITAVELRPDMAEVVRAAKRALW